MTDLTDDGLEGNHGALSEDRIRLICTIHLEVGDVAFTPPFLRHLLDHSFPATSDASLYQHTPALSG